MKESRESPPAANPEESATDSPPTLYLAYVCRSPLSSPDSKMQVLAGRTLSKAEVFEWIEQGIDVGHEILYEDITLENPGAHPTPPREALVYFTGITGEGWQEDCEWMDPVGRRGVVPGDYCGVPRPCPEKVEGADEDGYLEDEDLYVWRVPCHWMSTYLLAPFPNASNPHINEGAPWAV